MREVIVFAVLYGAIFFTFRRLGGLHAAAGWIEEWGRREATV
jgi:hypothetical protein